MVQNLESPRLSGRVDSPASLGVDDMSNGSSHSYLLSFL